MNYIHIASGEYPLTKDALRARFPNVIFPIPFEAPDGYAPVEFGTLPAHDAATHKAAELPPVEEGGQWLQRWDVVALTSQEIEDARRAMVPAAVTMRQARLALLGAGLLASVDAAIDGLPSPQKEAARIEWEYATEVQRLSGLVPMMGAALGLDDAALDDLFVAAVTL